MKIGPLEISWRKKDFSIFRSEPPGFGVGGGLLSVIGKRGPVWEESAVGACIRFACDTFPEAPMHVVRQDDQNEAAIVGHALTQLVRRPNPFYSSTGLWAGTMLSLLADGNAYWRLVRSAARRIVEAWYVPHYAMRVEWPQDGSEFISHYTYTGMGRQERVAVEDMVHFRVGIDPASFGRKGLSRLKAVTQEVHTDAEAAVAAYAMMRGRGIPGAIVRPAKGDEEVAFSEQQMTEIKNRYEQVTGQGRGGLLLLNLPMDVDYPTIDVERMAFEKIRTLSSDRVCAAIGVDPMVLGLPSTSKTYSNFAEAREAAFENFIVPMQRVCSDTLNLQLLPQLGDPDTEQVGFDLRKVRVLQEDENKKASRVGGLFRDGVVARQQAQELLGIDPPSSGDVYATDLQAGIDAAKLSLINQAKQRAKERREVVEAVGDAGAS